MAETTIIFEGRPACCGAYWDWCRRTQWKITTTYIEKSAGICCPRVDNLQLMRVKDISFKQRACTCCCGCCGIITIYSSDTTCPVLYIRGLPNSRKIYSAIRDAINAIHGNAKLEIDI